MSQAYWRLQNTFLPDDLQHDFQKTDLFAVFVLFYLGSLATLSIINVVIAGVIWSPRVENAEMANYYVVRLFSDIKIIG
jgi:hypothetical protein